MSCEEVLAALPDTIVQVDADYGIVGVNRPESPIFTAKAVPGIQLADVLDPEAWHVVSDMINNAEVTGGALTDLRAGDDLYRVTAKPLASVAVTLLVFRDASGITKRAPSIAENAS